MKNKSCLICGALGRGVSRECVDCHGVTEAGSLSGRIIYFGLRIDRVSNAAAYLEYLLRAAIGGILCLLGFWGLTGLGYLIFISGSAAVLSLDFWARPNPILFFFWITVLSDLYLWYRHIRAEEVKKPVVKHGFEEKAAGLSFVSWAEAADTKKKNWIDISSSFTNDAVKSLREAYKISRATEGSDVDLLHIFAALLRTREAIIIFGRLGVRFEDLREKISHAFANTPRGYSESWFSENAIKSLYFAYALAYEAKLRYVGPGLLLYAISRMPGPVNEILYDFEIDERKIKNVIAWLEMNKLAAEKYRKGRSLARRRPTHEAGRVMTSVATPFLDQFCEDVTLEARYGQIFPVVGRSKEAEAIFRVLEGGRKSVLLLGHPGVGKRSLVEGLAERMVEEDVPKMLHDKRLVSLSVSKILSNADSGEAVGRMQHIFNEIARSGNIVLYVPNVHDLASGGNVSGMDLSEVLAAELSKQYFFAICSTIPAEYRRLENTALADVLEKIEINEPSLDESIQILESKVGVFEYQSKVFFSYDAIERAVTFSDKYLPDRFLPDKAIEIAKEVAHAVRGKRGMNAVVVGEDVAEIISEKGHVPVTKVTEKEGESLLHLEEKMRERIVGQSEAISAVASAIRRARAGLRSESRPIANFLFLGPTGVGKTETAKTVAEVYFGSEENMIRLDMSEYQDKSSLHRLIGEPGGEPGGILTEAVRKLPFTLLLLDEIEKAHPDILNIFLQVMDDGRLTDNVGRTVDFTNVILIATSNAGTPVIQDEIKKGTPIGSIKEMLLNKELRANFRPEFLNRFDGVIVFTPLSEEEIRKVAGLMLKAVAKQLEKKGVTLRITEEAIAELAAAGFDPIFGARPLRRVIQEKVQDALANFMLANKLGRRDIVVLEPGGNIRIEKAEAL